MGASGYRQAPAVLYPREWLGGWEGLRAGLDTKARVKIRSVCWDPTPVVQSAVRHYTDWATPALIMSYYKKNYYLYYYCADHSGRAI
jgi:hypothetical protein